MYLNKVFLYGNLTRDPELKALPSGSQVANFGIATNRTYKDKSGAKQEATEFHNIVAFGRTAEVIAQYMKKGRPIFVEGRIQTRSWEITFSSVLTAGRAELARHVLNRMNNPLQAKVRRLSIRTKKSIRKIFLFSN